MSASAPVIRTSKPPSGLSHLTAPKPAKEVTSSLKSLLGRSRPASRESNGNDSESIGSVSVDPNGAQYGELRARHSSDSWEKKQVRATKGLMYMSSKERLRDTERKRASAGISSSPGSDRPPKLTSDKRSFMSETPITEEPGAEGEFDGPAPSPGIGPASPIIGLSNGGIGSGRYIPARDSSLTSKKRTSASNKRSSRHTSMDRSGKTIREEEESTVAATNAKLDKDRKHHGRSGSPTKFSNPLPGPKIKQPETTAVKSDLLPPHQKEGVQSIDRSALAVNGNKESGGSEDKRKAKKSGRLTPDPFERFTHRDSKRDSQKSNRLSEHLSGADSETENSRPSRNLPELKGQRASAEAARPSSADSIDDAVDAYLSSPRLSQKIRHPQTGRIISFSEVGDPNGFAVFCCVGMGLTRFITAFYDELALTLKLRLITPDRPGVGDSEPYSDGTATPLSWPGMLLH